MTEVEFEAAVVKQMNTEALKELEGTVGTEFVEIDAERSRGHCGLAIDLQSNAVACAVEPDRLIASLGVDSIDQNYQRTPSKARTPKGQHIQLWDRS